MVIQNIEQVQSLLNNTSLALDTFKVEVEKLIELAENIDIRIKRAEDMEKVAKLRDDELIRRENSLGVESDKLQGEKKIWENDYTNKKSTLLTLSTKITELDNVIVEKESRVKELESIVNDVADKESKLKALAKELEEKGKVVNEQLEIDKERKKFLDIKEEKLKRKEEQLQKLSEV